MKCESCKYGLVTQFNVHHRAISYRWLRSKQEVDVFEAHRLHDPLPMRKKVVFSYCPDCGGFLCQ